MAFFLNQVAILAELPRTPYTGNPVSEKTSTRKVGE
jgi:hypothetical protein